MGERKPWGEYSLGTRAYSSGGGHWEKVATGWKWCTGSVFPTPGGDVVRIVSPTTQEEKRGGK